jgi:vitellogenic carboxypeptidase-like protein
MKSTKHLYEYLLDAPNKYRVLLYSGHWDLIVPTVETENVISKLVWSGSARYLEAKKTIWRAGGKEILGYSKKIKNLRLLIIRNSGHLAPFDQPEVLFKMITTLTAGKAFL